MKKLLVLFLMVCSLVIVTACTPKQYTVTLKFEDGAVFETITVEEGISTTLNTPSKDGYTFVGWYDGDVLVNGNEGFESDTVLTAKFNINSYTYKFIVEGTIVKEETLEYGSTISYPEEPTKEATAENSYVFSRWDNDATTLLKDEVFNAVFESSKNTYTYKFVDDNNKVIKEETLEYGSSIVYPENPEKEATAEYTYTFTGWDNDATVLTDNIVFKATYSKVKNQYTYKFLNEDGTVLKEETVDYGTMPVAPSDPVKEATSEFEYEFIGWDKTISKVTGNVEYTAKYKEIEIKEEITSLDGLKISFLGDSISTFYDENSPVNSLYGGKNEYYYPIYSSTVTKVEYTWWYQVVQETKTSLVANDSWSGSSCYNNGSEVNSGAMNYNRINNLAGSEIVVILIGTNDNVNGHEGQHEGDIPDFQLCNPKKNKGCQGHGNQQRCVECGHGSQGPGYKANKFAGAGKPMDHGGTVDVIKQIDHLRTSRSLAMNRRVNSSGSLIPQAADRWYSDVSFKWASSTISGEFRTSAADLSAMT